MHSRLAKQNQYPELLPQRPGSEHLVGCGEHRDLPVCDALVGELVPRKDVFLIGRDDGNVHEMEKLLTCRFKHLSKILSRLSTTSVKIYVVRLMGPADESIPLYIAFLSPRALPLQSQLLRECRSCVWEAGTRGSPPRASPSAPSHLPRPCSYRSP